MSGRPGPPSDEQGDRAARPAGGCDPVALGVRVALAILLLPAWLLVVLLYVVAILVASACRAGRHAARILNPGTRPRSKI